jgi:DNA-binding NarL/FixJ family response regulator
MAGSRHQPVPCHQSPSIHRPIPLRLLLKEATVTNTSATSPSMPSHRRRIVDRIREAVTTPGSQLLISGEAGIGKSFLLRAALRDRAIDGHAIFSEGQECGQAPYLTVREIFSRAPQEAVRTLPQPLKDAYSTTLDDHTGVETWKISSAAMAAVAGHLLNEYARRGMPLVLENWQWIDPASRRVLEEVFRQPSVRASVSVVATTRDSFLAIDRTPTTIFDIRDTITVPPIQPEDLRNVIYRTVDLPLAPNEEAELIDLSRGNPLWAFELAALRRTNAPSGTVPPRIASIIQDQLSLLSPAVVRLVQTVSALQRVRVADSTRYLPGGAEELSTALSAGVVRVQENCIYPAHPLLAQASLDMLTATERSRLFQELSKLPLSSTRRAELLDAGAGSGSDETVARALSAAADDQRMAGAVLPAARLARRALSRTAIDCIDLPARQLYAASYTLASGDINSALHDLMELDTSRLSSDAFDHLVEVFSEALYRTGGEALIHRHLGILRSRVDLSDTQRDVVNVYLHCFARNRTREHLQQLRLLDSRLSERTTPRAKAAAKGALLEIQADTGGGIDEDALTHLRRIEAHSLPSTSERGADAIEGFLSYQIDDLARSRAALSNAMSSAYASGERYALLQVAAHSSIVQTLSGHVPAAATLLSGVAETEATLKQHLPASIYRAKGLLALAQDDGDRVREIAADSFSPGGEHRGELLRKSLLGLLAAQRAEPETAVELLSSAVQAAEQRGISEPGRRLWIDVELVRALISLGNLDRASRAIARLEQATRDPRRLYARGQMDRLTALLLSALGDHASAVQLIDRAITRITNSGFRTEAVRALIDQAHIVGKSGNVLRVPEILGVAQKANRDIESVSLERQISGLLNSHVRAQSVEILTPSERRVADLIAQGHSNRSAALALHLSQRTVETHLSSIYRKTGAHSRTQLVLRMAS